MDDFRRRATRIVLVTFGNPEWVRMWQEETASPFRILLDPERHAYRAFGLERSHVRVFSPRTLLRYGRQMLSGNPIPPKRGDPFQLGGDFVVDRDGTILYAHASRTPSDRPPVEEILAALDAAVRER